MKPSYMLACSKVLHHFPELKREDLPKLQFHATLIKVLAYCYFDKNVIVASKRHYDKNVGIFAHEVFLHELAHFVAYKLYSCTNHGKAWKSVCYQLGIPARLGIQVEL